VIDQKCCAPPLIGDAEQTPFQIQLEGRESVTISKHSALGVVAFALAMTVAPAAAATGTPTDPAPCPQLTAAASSLPATAFKVSGTTSACQPV
jgi:hypothetical protein